MSNYLTISKNMTLIPVLIQLIMLIAALIIYVNYAGEGILKHVAIFISLIASIIMNVFLGRRLISLSLKNAQLEVKEAMADSITKLASAMEEQNNNFISQIEHISTLLQNQQTDELEAYLGQISNCFLHLNDAIKVDQPIIGALLRSKLAEAEIRNIRFETDISVLLSRYEEKALDLARILGNLINNAFDAVIFSEGDEKKVFIKINRVGPLLQFKVHNGGTAIPPEEMDHIFTEGYTRKGKGHSGMGLHIVKTLTEKISGTVSVSSDEHTGTSFIVKVPA